MGAPSQRKVFRPRACVSPASRHSAEPPGLACDVLTIWLDRPAHTEKSGPNTRAVTTHNASPEQVSRREEVLQAPEDREARPGVGGSRELRWAAGRTELADTRTIAAGHLSPHDRDWGTGPVKLFGLRLGRARLRAPRSGTPCAPIARAWHSCAERAGAWRRGLAIKDQVSCGRVERFFSNFLMTQDI